MDNIHSWHAFSASSGDVYRQYLPCSCDSVRSLCRHICCPATPTAAWAERDTSCEQSPIPPPPPPPPEESQVGIAAALSQEHQDPKVEIDEKDADVLREEGLGEVVLAALPTPPSKVSRERDLDASISPSAALHAQLEQRHRGTREKDIDEAISPSAALQSQLAQRNFNISASTPPTSLLPPPSKLQAQVDDYNAQIVNMMKQKLKQQQQSKK